MNSASEGTHNILASVKYFGTLKRLKEIFIYENWHKYDAFLKKCKEILKLKKKYMEVLTYTQIKEQ